MNLRFLFAVLVAMAMGFAPLAMPLGEANAATPAAHAGMSKAGHCDDKSGPAQPKMDHAKPCCAAGCMAAATLGDVEQASIELPGASQRPGLDSFHRGYLGEIATPPPRFS